MKIIIKTNNFILITCGRGWTVVISGTHRRSINGILGLLCRTHFPGMVRVGEEEKPVDTWRQYASFPDFPDREGRRFDNKAARVRAELWVSFPRIALLNTSFSLQIFWVIDCIYRVYMQDFYRCEQGYEVQAEEQINKACRKLVADMEYEARIQAVIDYYALYKPPPRYKVDKTEARTIKLTVEQYIEVIVIF